MEGTNKIPKRSAVRNSRLHLWLFQNVLRKPGNVLLKDSAPSENFRGLRSSLLAGSATGWSVSEVVGRHGMLWDDGKLCKTRLSPTVGEEGKGRKNFKA